jgi:hypothetical protein
VDNGWFALGGEELGGRDERGADGATCWIDQMDVEVTNWLASHRGVYSRFLLEAVF